MPPSTPPDEPTVDYVRAVLLRGCIDELRYPRLCAARFCRRHHACRDHADRDPQCVARLDAVDLHRLTELNDLVTGILTGRIPPRPSEDPVQHELEDEALCVLYDCFDALPWFQERLLAWIDRYDRPPQPPEDAQQLLADIRRDMARNAAMDSARGL
jgi:hypothetical protein